MKTRITRLGAVGRIAQCHSCVWSLEDDGGQEGYRKISRHVAKTDHKVLIETTYYSECIPRNEK